MYVINLIVSKVLGTDYLIKKNNRNQLIYHLKNINKKINHDKQK